MVDSTWHDFVRAYARYKGSRNWHPDLADFYERRYRVYSELLAIDLEDTSNFDRRQATVYELVFDKLSNAYEQRVSPFAGILAAPKPAITMINNYDRLIKELISLEKQIYADGLVAAAIALWGPCPRSITAAELAAHSVGVDDEPREEEYY